MMSRPVPAPRTREGKQVAKTSLEKVTDLSVDQARVAPARDLNLTALISEVERDILALEQLEQKSTASQMGRLKQLLPPIDANHQFTSDKEEKATPDSSVPIPLSEIVITEEILNLPGYKPKSMPVISTVQSSKSPTKVGSGGRLHKKTSATEATVAAASITDGETKLVIKQLQPPPPTSHEHHVNPILAGLPPALPPKRGVVGTVNDPPLASIPDTLHTRLLPRENCVTNILYSRRLPSPPVFRRDRNICGGSAIYSQTSQSTILQPQSTPTPSRAFHRDDQFFNRREPNYYEEVRDPRSSGGDRRDLYCPLCNCGGFGYSFGLECHLLSAHQDILRVAKNEEQFLQEVMISRSEWCPVCRAQFLTPGLVVKHLVSVHPEYILNFVDPPAGGADSNTLRKKSTSFNCGFCGQHFPKRHHKLIMTHVEQKHLGELEAVLLSSNRLCGPAAVAHQQDPTAVDSNDNNVELSNEVCMMLSLSKTVNFSLESPPGTLKLPDASAPSASAAEPNKAASSTNPNKWLRSSLRRSSGKKSRVECPVIRQSLHADKQYLTHEASERLKAEPSNKTEDNPNGRREVKKDLRFSIPQDEGEDHQYDTIDTPEGPRQVRVIRSMTPKTGKRLHFGPPESFTYRNMEVPPTPAMPPLPPLFTASKKNSVGSSVGSSEEDCMDTTSSSSSSSSSRKTSTQSTVSNGRQDKPLLLFKCNLCEASFADNEILLSHLKNRHQRRRGLPSAAAAGVMGFFASTSNSSESTSMPPFGNAMARALKPQFSCGICPAKFFKNSFLIKHCESHEKSR